MADALDQDVQALKEWLKTASRYLADPAFTTFERRELRNYMKEADAALRTGLQKQAAIERARNEREACVYRKPYRIDEVMESRKLAE